VYQLIGTYENGTLTLTEPPSTGAVTVPAPIDAAFRVPCAEPAGGWRVVDPAHTKFEDYEAIMKAISDAPDYAGSWGAGHVEGVAGQPLDQVLVAGFTGDIDRHRAELEKLWGGAICVTQLRYSQAELNDVAEDFRNKTVPEFGVRAFDSFADGVYQHAQVDIDILTVELQKAIAERYGDKVVPHAYVMPYNG
jgi:hypothetical protein